MNLTQRITSNNDFFYKKKTIPTIKVGDKVKVLNYLELPTDEESNSKTKDKKIAKKSQFFFLCHQRLVEIRRISNIVLISYCVVPNKVGSINNSFKFFKIIQNLSATIYYTK